MELGLRARVLKTSGASLVRQEAGVAEFLADRAKNTIPPRRNISFWYWAEGGEGATIPVPTATGLKGEGVVPAWDPTDTDGDTLPDVMEHQLESDPALVDTDGDGLPDAVEWLIGTDPTKPDTDGDGVGDGHEDADHDGVNNLDEVNRGTVPTRADTDEDKLTDGKEHMLGTNPLVTDTDGDKVGDGTEVEIGSNPLVAETAFDVTRAVTGTPIAPSVRIRTLAGEQVSSFRVTPLPSDDRVMPSSIPGFLGQGYEFEVSGTFAEAEVTWLFTIEGGWLTACADW